MPTPGWESAHAAMGVFDAIQWVRDVDGLSLAQAAVLMALATRVDDKHQCFPSYKRIASDICSTRKTVIQTVKELEAGDLIRIEPQYRPAGGRTSNLYTVLVPPGHCRGG